MYMYIFNELLNKTFFLFITLAAEKQILTGEQDIFLKKTLLIDTYAKKGESTEGRIMVCSVKKISLFFIHYTLTIIATFFLIDLHNVQHPATN